MLISSFDSYELCRYEILLKSDQGPIDVSFSRGKSSVTPEKRYHKLPVPLPLFLGANHASTNSIFLWHLEANVLLQHLT